MPVPEILLPILDWKVPAFTQERQSGAKVNGYIWHCDFNVMANLGTGPQIPDIDYGDFAIARKAVDAGHARYDEERDVYEFVAPEIGSVWHHVIDGYSYKVVETSIDSRENQNPHELRIILEAQDTGYRHALSLTAFRSVVIADAVSHALEPTEIERTFRFECLSAPPVAIGFWAGLWSWIAGHFKHETKSPIRALTVKEVRTILADETAAELWVINRALIDGLTPQILIPISRSNEHAASALLVSATWAPQNLLDQVSASVLKQSEWFFKRLVDEHRMLVCIDSKSAQLLLKDSDVRAEVQRQADIIKSMKDAREARENGIAHPDHPAEFERELN